MKGVNRVTAGYAGGIKKNPTYRSLGKHTEVVEVEFDPSVVKYEELLDTFWANHNAYSRPGSSQYKSIIFYHDEKQKSLAEKAKKKLDSRRGRPVNTQIRKAGPFWVAEGYHQKYYLQNADFLYASILREFKSEEELFASTIAARLNAWLAGCGEAGAVYSALEAMKLKTEVLEEWRKWLGLPEKEQPRRTF